METQRRREFFTLACSSKRQKTTGDKGRNKIAAVHLTEKKKSLSSLKRTARWIHNLFFFEFIFLQHLREKIILKKPFILEIQTGCEFLKIVSIFKTPSIKPSSLRQRQEQIATIHQTERGERKLSSLKRKLGVFFWNGLILRERSKNFLKRKRVP